MNTLPAKDFLQRFTSAYGMQWNEVFDEYTKKPPCAKQMAEFIDDLEMYGQQTPVYVDKDGMVAEGNKLCLALFVLGENIEYSTAPPPEEDENQIWILEFDIDSEVGAEFYGHLIDYLSFRIDDDWVYPMDAHIEDDSVMVEMHCASGESVSNRLGFIVSDRLHTRAGISISGVRVSAPEWVDEDTSE